MRRKTRIRTDLLPTYFLTHYWDLHSYFLTVLFINPISKIGNVNMKAEYIVTVGKIASQMM